MSILNEEINKYSVTINNFEGPLDLLCYLIDKNKTSIFDISLSELTDSYIEYIDQMEKMNLEIASEFLIMASNLVYIKSKKLLPEINDVEDEEEETEEQLMQRIIEYKKYKKVSLELRQLYEKSFGKVVKPTENIKLPTKDVEVKYTALDLNEVYLEILNRNTQKVNVKAREIEEIAVTEKVTVKSKVKEMISVLFRKTSFIFNKLFNVEEKSNIEIVTAFLGMLELAKLKHVDIIQENPFGDIVVKKNGDKEINMDLEFIEE